jgi:hypothetical protein
VLRKVKPNGYEDRTLADADDLMSVLKDEIGVDVPEARSLWPSVVARHEEVMAEKEN